jgi:hypothetical protein
MSRFQLFTHWRRTAIKRLPSNEPMMSKYRYTHYVQEQPQLSLTKRQC